MMGGNGVFTNFRVLWPQSAGFLTMERTESMHNLLTPPFADVSLGERFADAGMTVLIGLVVVFSVLILLTFIFYLFGKIVGRPKGPKPAPAPEKKTEPIVRQPAPAPVVPAPVVEEGIGEEVVAVIAAAVAAMSGPAATFTLRRVQRSREGRPAWGAAGLAEQTRPF